MGLQNIFPVPIYTTLLDSDIIKYMEDLIIPKLDNLDKITTRKTDFFKPRIVSYKDLSPFLSSLKNPLTDYSLKSNLLLPSNLEYWVQDYSKNESHLLHAHGDSVISGVYYVRASKNAGVLKFSNPNPLFTVTNFKEGPKEEIYYSIKPQRGLLVLFPSWLSHEVIPSLEEDCIRTCLAFNLKK
jgi:hypothetical protein